MATASPTMLMSCSGADLDTMRGFMKGSFQMAVLGEE